MNKIFIVLLTLSACFQSVQAQKQSFPQQEINAVVARSFSSSLNKTFAGQASDQLQTANNSSLQPLLKKMNEAKNTNWEKYRQSGSHEKQLDTVYVGEVPNDTLVITGVYEHTGPVFVFNDGVLIFNNADATNYGDVFVFGHGQVLGLNSSLTFPQDYFYQRSLLVVQHGLAYFNNCSFDYSGVQHSLVIGDSGTVGMENVHQRDWTTAGLFGAATLQIHGLNLGGEYILSDSCTAAFSNVDTLLLWHKMPNTAVIDYAFPQGDTVYNYQFNNSLPGVSGTDYTVFADSCYTVWWGMMPVNGSDVTISNSNIRLIGAWFEHGDSTTANGIFNNTYYPNTVIPMPDRNLHLLNCFVQTWSLYVFDTSHLNIINCSLGEVGTQQKAQVISDQFLLDGSGGYFWATDTSAVFASNVTVYSTARSERNGIFVLAYSNLPFSTATSVGSSLFVSVQNTLPADPVPFDGSIMWVEALENDSVAHVDSLIPINGSAWIDQGPLGSWMNFSSYSLYYQLQGTTGWTAIVTDSAAEIRHNMLGIWNTIGLAAGDYLLKLVVKNDLTDSVEDFMPITLLPSMVGLNTENLNNTSVAFFPNPANNSGLLAVSINKASALKIILTDMEGRELSVIAEVMINAGLHRFPVNCANLPAGIYCCRILTEDHLHTQKFIVLH